MFISYKWLNEMITVPVDAKHLADKMSTTGIEIESVQNLGETLKKLVVGKTLDVVEHPNSDHLHICQVDVGEHADGAIQIVCGAPNVARGQKVIVALNGARIKDNIKIKKGKIRGQESNGMLCSLEELGFSSSVIPKEVADGIFILPENAPLGADIIDYLGLDDAILELSITPNRADALSMYGTAYEVGAIYNQVPVFEEYTAQSVDENNDIQLTVEDTAQCPVYQMALIKNVTIQPSPLWLQMRLMKMGIRPINNVVDVTNYMLMLYGQPMHAFDYHQLPTKDITVRQAKANETLVTLDGIERTLSQEDLVISSNQQAVALAGVMGGLATEITEQTTTVALEVAVFNATSVRQTSKRHQLRSESSTRFEKGVHLNMLETVVKQATALIAKLSGGTVVSDVKSINHLGKSPATVSVALDKINRILGTQLTKDEVNAIFNRLGFTSVYTEGTFSVTIPLRRWDIQIEADLIEEVARLYGYDNLPSTLPVTPSISGGLSPLQTFMRQSRKLLESFGYTQTIGYSLTSAKKAGLLAKCENSGICLAMPMSEERSQLRRSLLSSLLDIAHYNVARSQTDLALYETGRVFFNQEGNAQPLEEEHIALLLTGNRQEKTWIQTNEPVDFYTLKGSLDAYFEAIGVVDNIQYQAIQKENMHPGRTAIILLNEQPIGFIGQIHPHLAKDYDLNEVYVAEFEIRPLLDMTREKLVQKTVPKYPSMTRDMALLVDKTLPNQDIMQVLQQSAGQYLVSVKLFDYYVGKGIELDKKSLAYRLTFQNLEATLVEDDINQAMANVVTALQTAFDVEIR